jgi:hypothetical protein
MSDDFEEWLNKHAKTPFEIVKPLAPLIHLQYGHISEEQIKDRGKKEWISVDVAVAEHNKAIEEAVKIAQINFQNWHHSEMEKLVNKYERDGQKKSIQELHDNIIGYLNDYDVVTYLEKANVKYDSWLKAKIFEMLDEIRTAIITRYTEYQNKERFGELLPKEVSLPKEPCGICGEPATVGPFAGGPVAWYCKDCNWKIRKFLDLSEKHEAFVKNLRSEAKEGDTKK